MTFLLPGTKPETTPRGAKEDAAYEEAKAARHARRARDKALAWEKAVKQVSAWPVSMAVEALTNMPQGIQQMYLLAEEVTLNRSEVLRFFPAVAPSTRETWSEVVSPSAPKASPSRQKRKAS